MSGEFNLLKPIRMLTACFCHSHYNHIDIAFIYYAHKKQVKKKYRDLRRRNIT